MRKALKIQLGVLIVSTGIGIIFLNCFREKEGAEKQPQNIALTSNRPALGTEYAKLDSVDSVRRKRLAGETVSDPKQSRPLPAIKSAIQTTMLKQEATRCRVLKTYSNDSSDFTLVAVDLPSSEQIEEIRHAISASKNDCSKSDLQELDDAVTELIKEYDPFGALGKRAFFVTVSKGDSATHCSAFVFTVDNFEGLSEKVDPNSNVPYPMKNAKWYQNPSGGVLNRLREIMR